MARGKEIPIKYKSARGHEFTFAREFEGVVGNLERRYRETNSEYIRERITEYMSDKPCPTCKGKRLRPEAIAVTVAGANIMRPSWPIQRTSIGSPS
jgi:excinuclease ABC subunit A